MVTAPAPNCAGVIQGQEKCWLPPSLTEGQELVTWLKNVPCLGLTVQGQLGGPRAQIASGSQAQDKEVALGTLPPGHTAHALPCPPWQL